MRKQIEGFDYRQQRPVLLTRAEWRALIGQTITDGGKRRCEQGETFLHGADGRIVAEVYANIPAP